MKTSFLQLLIFSAGPVLAHSHSGHVEICGLGSSIIPPGGPVCLTDPRYLASGRSNITTQQPLAEHGSSSCQQHAWTHSSPCFQGPDAADPICVFTDANFAQGRGISLVTTRRRANFLASTSAFTDPELTRGINQDLDNDNSAKYEVRSIPGKGMGLVATQPIQRGELIMANTASLMTDYRAFDELTRAQYTELQAAAVWHLPSAHRGAVLNLSSHDDDARAGLSAVELVDKIAGTNSFDIDPHPDEYEYYHSPSDSSSSSDEDSLDDSDSDAENSFFTLFPAIARLNHDCRPNAEYRFTHATLSQSIRAARDIAPGEELTLSYIDAVAPRAARVRRLRETWGFECSCPLCVLEPAARVKESDRRIGEIVRVRAVLKDWSAGSAACPAMAELLVSLYEMERLWGSMHEAYALAALEYSAVGEPWDAMRYARLAVEWGIPMLGEEDEDVVELGRLAEDPWGHWSWLRRVRQRGRR